MARLSRPAPVKLIFGILYAEEERFLAAREALVEISGPLDHVSEPIPFRASGYYEDELGPEPLRRFVSAEALVSPGKLARLKRITCAMARRFADGEGRRSVNLDPGTLEYGKIVLASLKEGPHKIYLGRGVWADLLLHRHRGAWKPLDWTFPDFRNGLYDVTFNRIRELYRTQRRAR